MRKIYAERYRMIGRKIAFYRSLRGLNQEQLAEKAGISVSYVKKIESGKTARAFSLYILFVLSDTLGVDAVDLIKPVSELK